MQMRLVTYRCLWLAAAAMTLTACRAPLPFSAEEPATPIAGPTIQRPAAIQRPAVPPATGAAPIVAAQSVAPRTDVAAVGFQASDVPAESVVATANLPAPFGPSSIPQTPPVSQATAVLPTALPPTAATPPAKGAVMPASGKGAHAYADACGCASCGRQRLLGRRQNCQSGCGCCQPAATGWIAPEIKCPWSDDEYLCDGGDQGVPAAVMKDWTVGGLEQEDTVIHYDTIQGDTHIQPSNRVCIYAPRFAAVRRVYGTVQANQAIASMGIDVPLQAQRMDDLGVPTTVLQPVQPGRNIGTHNSSTFRERTRGVGLDNSLRAKGAHGGFLPYEDLALIQRGIMDNSEKARLANRVEAALAWSSAQAVQVMIDNIVANEDVGVTSSQTIKEYDLDGKSRVRICKIASTKDALPGDIVEFTLRFDNVGDLTIGNVVIMDNLTTRLEYIEDSQSCTREARFSAEENEGESLKLRWELTDPLEVGDGGIIRFRCRVR